ncbi:unnamed protein product [Urochloa decumbens]|uniref:DUF1618 domain-containing protein n=1 Tax=Urochloa decumbens TaxID=240449 RepID=A0ABC8YZL2_9POAL
MSTPLPHHHPHLYLVLEGSEDEYSIHKIDVHDFDPDDTDDLDSLARPLPEPPLLRVEGARRSAMCFTAHGTKIFAMPPSPGCAAFALDTRTMKITTGPLPEGAEEDQFCYSNLVVVGDRLYSMDRRERGDAESYNFEVLQFGSASRSWSWSSVPSQPPFNPLFVTCYAVHPDARTIFFSVSHSGIDPPFRRERRSGDDAGATFSFDTEAAEWTFRGYWTLPFHRQAHYDEELDAWVGLHEEDGRKGRVASCDVLPPATGDVSADRSSQAPPWKLARERLFRVKGRRHRGGALVYMGGSKFCTVERATEEELTREQRKRLELDGRQPRLLLYVRTFGLKYGKKGRLQVATCGRRARCYTLPEGTSNDIIFWSLRALWA